MIDPLPNKVPSVFFWPQPR
jgi:hypothetical protein